MMNNLGKTIVFIRIDSSAEWDRVERILIDQENHIWTASLGTVRYSESSPHFLINWNMDGKKVLHRGSLETIKTAQTRSKDVKVFSSYEKYKIQFDNFDLEKARSIIYND